MRKIILVLYIISISFMVQGCGIFSKRLVPVVSMPDAPIDLMITPEKLKPIKNKDNEGNE